MYLMRQGLGAAAPTSTIVETSVGAALLSAAPFTGPAAPFVALAGGVSDLLAAIGVGAGCGQSCITASQYADKAQALMLQNLQTYMALAKPRAQSAQAAALSVFDQLWSGYETACATVPGAAGQNCIADRQEGACKYQANGACWNWFVGFRDPIANDPNVVPDSQAVGSTASSLLSSVSGSSSMLPWALAAAAVVAVFVLAG